MLLGSTFKQVERERMRLTKSYDQMMTTTQSVRKLVTMTPEVSIQKEGGVANDQEKLNTHQRKLKV